MIKVTHSDIGSIVGARSIQIRYNGFIISLAGFNDYDRIAVNRAWTHMTGMRLFLDDDTKREVTKRHPAYGNGEIIEVDDFEDILRTVRLINDGCFNE